MLIQVSNNDYYLELSFYILNVLLKVTTGQCSAGKQQLPYPFLPPNKSLYLYHLPFSWCTFSHHELISISQHVVTENRVGKRCTVVPLMSVDWFQHTTCDIIKTKSRGGFTEAHIKLQVINATSLESALAMWQHGHWFCKFCKLCFNGNTYGCFSLP